MANQSLRFREQEHSIKERKRLLYEDDEPLEGETTTVPIRSFAEYLQTTPAAPLSPGAKAVLWSIAAVVVLLLLAALYLATR